MKRKKFIRRYVSDSSCFGSQKSQLTQESDKNNTQLPLNSELPVSINPDTPWFKVRFLHIASTLLWQD